MKETLKQIMIKGGFSVIIAVVAMSLYLTAIHFANKYFDNITKPADITVNDKGEIKIEGFEAEKNEIIYVLWETDGGNIKPIENNSEFQEQNKQENNKWYYANTSIEEGVVWSSSDADGNEYTTATVRAIIYSYDKNSGNNQYYMGNYVNEMTITVTDKNGKIEKSENERYFSNPVRAEGDNNWSQIYSISEDEEGLVTYRYRTGQNIDDELLILSWESDESILCETDYEAGLYPRCSILEDNKNKNLILAKDTITIDKNMATGKKIYGYLIDEDTYESADEGVSESKKQHKAEIVVE